VNGGVSSCASAKADYVNSSKGAEADLAVPKGQIRGYRGAIV